MSRFQKALLVTGICVPVLLVGAWGGIYAFAKREIQVLPQKGAVVDCSDPTISISWPYALGARLISYEVFLDGNNINHLIDKTPGGLKYLPNKLPEGRHTLNGELTYWWLIKRRLKIRSYFTTDTVSPSVRFAHSSDAIAVPRSWIHNLEGSTEPGSKLRVNLNGRKLSAPSIDKAGHFSISLYQLSDSNKLRVSAVDRAGNRKYISIPVKIDRSAPSIAELAPGDGQIVHDREVSISAVFDEGDSKIAKSVLRIDNQQVTGELDPEKKKFIYESDGLSHGVHSAVLEVSDSAGNSTLKRWSFTVDTTKLVLSLSQRKIFFYRNGALVKTYPCAVGKAGFSTPKGHWKVVGKRRNPAWYNPGSGWSSGMPAVIPPGPGNPLGTRAIELNAPAIRIHGTPNPGSVGTAASHGCIRMYRNDVEELFEEVTIGVPVDIQD